MKDWKPYTYLSKPDQSKKDCKLFIVVKIPEGYSLERVVGPCYEQAPDAEYDNPPNGYCSDEVKPYTLTRVIYYYTKGTGASNSEPHEYAVLLQEKDFKKDCAVQVVVARNPANVHHDGSSVPHYPDAD